MATKPPSHEATKGRSFTLPELMIAVAVLIVVLLATSKIFETASQVAGLGEATTNVMQEAATIERNIREDFRRLSNDGFMAIRCVAVRNDVNLPAGALLNPALPADAVIRADQLFFFIGGAQHMMTLGTRGTNIQGLGVSARVYYGPAIQLELEEAEGVAGDVLFAHDFKVDPTDPLLPWHVGQYNTVRTAYHRDEVPPNQEYMTTNAGPADATQPPATQWILARHALAMADDGDGQPQRYLYGNRTGYRIDHHTVFHGRVDGVAELLPDVRRRVTVAPTTYTCDSIPDQVVRPWYDPSYGPGDQRDAIAALCGRGRLVYNPGGSDHGDVFGANLPVYPRAQRIAPGLQRVDQALTNHVIGTACSSFTVDWTYAPGTGELRNVDDPTMYTTAPWANGVLDSPGVCGNANDPNLSGDDTCLTGLEVNADQAGTAAYREQPWFGLDGLDLDPDNATRGVYLYGTDRWPWWQRAPTIDSRNIEEIVFPASPGPDEPLVVYEAIFGYNRGTLLNENGNPDTVIYDTSDPDCTRVGYTPWPAALRITMTLHDSLQRFGEGRKFQFVVDLPRRN